MNDIPISTSEVLVVDGKKLVGEAMPDILAKFQAQVVGQRIVAAGYIKGDATGAALPAVRLANGTVLYAMQDDEGNGPGVLFCNDTMLCETSHKP